MDRPYTLGRVGEFTLVEFNVVSLTSPAELERLSAWLSNLIDDDECCRLLLDFKKIEYLSSQGIGLIMALQRKLSKIPGGKLVICGLQPGLLKLLKITRLDQVLRIVGSQRDILA